MTQSDDVVADSNSQTSSYFEHPQEADESNAQLMDSEDVTASARSVDSMLVSVRVASETTAVDEAGDEGCTTPLNCSSQKITDRDVSQLETIVSSELLCVSENISQAASDDGQQHEKKLSPVRRTVATQTDAYDSDDDDESSDEESSSSDADSDSSSVCSSDSSVHSTVSSPFAANHCIDDSRLVSQPGADYSNNSPSTPEEETEKASSSFEVHAVSYKSGDNLSNSISSTDCTDGICADDPSTKQMPSPVALLSLEQKNQENCGSELDSETTVDDASRHPTISPCVNSQLCDGADCSSTSNARLHRGSAVAVFSPPTEQAVMVDVDRVSSSFKMPGCSPDSVCRLTSDTYQSSCGAYNSPQSNYGGVASDCSPPSCVQLLQNGSQNSLGGIVGYSMPTPSPTNSSARSFNMASPGSYQQLASVSQLEQSGTSCCQMEPTGYQPTSSLPASVTSYQQPPIENYPQALPPHHQTVTPPMERVNSQCPSASDIDYLHPGCHLADTSMSQMMGWSSLYMQQQQQHSGVKPVEFVPQIAGQGHMIRQTSCRSSSSSLGCQSDTDKQRRYSTKNCHKHFSSRSLMRAAHTPNAVPNVAIQPGTNLITGYDVYSPSIAECAANPHGGEMLPALDYHSLHRRTALGYHGGYVSDHPHVRVPANVYQYQQPATGGYAASAQSNHIHGQSVCPSSVAYGYMNRTLMGHNTFDMNLMRH